MSDPAMPATPPTPVTEDDNALPGPLADVEDPEEMIREAILDDSRRMVERMNTLLSDPDMSPVRVMSLMEGYLRSQRRVIAQIGMPGDETEGLEPDMGPGFVGGFGPPQAQMPRAQGLRRVRGDGVMVDVGQNLAGPFARRRGGPAEQMVGYVAEIGKAQEIQALTTALRHATVIKDRVLVATIRKRLDAALGTSPAANPEGDVTIEMEMANSPAEPAEHGEWDGHDEEVPPGVIGPGPMAAGVMFVNGG